jgi:hypothetical protein
LLNAGMEHSKEAKLQLELMLSIYTSKEQMKQLSQRLGLLRWFAKFILIMINQSNDTNLIMKFNAIFKRTQHIIVLKKNEMSGRNQNQLIYESY